MGRVGRVDCCEGSGLLSLGFVMGWGDSIGRGRAIIPGYKHPLELLTHYLCIFGSEAVLSTPTSFLVQNREALKTFRHEEAQKNGVEVHPQTLLSTFPSASVQQANKRLRASTTEFCG